MSSNSGGREVDEGAEYLLEIEKLIREHNEKGSAKLRLPDLKMAITGTQYGFLRSDVIYVVPVGCLRD